MRQFKWQEWWMALLCVVMVAGFTGCEGDDKDPPDNISGAWACTFTRAGSEQKQETWTFAQSGQAVTGSYTYGTSRFTFSGTYVDGAFVAVDSDNWTLRLNFEGDSASGTIAGVAETGESQVWNASLSR